MNEILKQLLDDLAAVAEQGNEEIFDTDVRERMFEAVRSGFIEPKQDYRLPQRFGTFSAEANEQIRSALSGFITKAGDYAGENELHTVKKRLSEFQNDEVTGGKEEFTHDDFFGYFDYEENAAR